MTVPTPGSWQWYACQFIAQGIGTAIGVYAGSKAANWFWARRHGR